MPQVRRDSVRKRRQRLAPPWAVLATGAAILVLMIAIFPSSSWLRQASAPGSKDQADSLKVLLLRNLLLKGQGGLALREDYALQLALIGDYPEAFAVLDTLIRDPGQDSLVPLRMLEARLAERALATPLTPAMDALAHAHLQAALEGILNVEAAPLAALTWAADRAIRTGQARTAYRLYLRLARLDGAKAENWELLAARSAAAVRDFPAAAGLYAQALEHTRDQKWRKVVLLEGMRNLQAAERLDLALTLGEAALPGLQADADVVSYLVRLARAANRPKDAGHFADILVRPDAFAEAEP